MEVLEHYFSIIFNSDKLLRPASHIHPNQCDQMLE